MKNYTGTISVRYCFFITTSSFEITHFFVYNLSDKKLNVFDDYLNIKINTLTPYVTADNLKSNKYKQFWKFLSAIK